MRIYTRPHFWIDTPAATATYSWEANLVKSCAALHLGLELLEQSLELVHVGLLLGPADAETFRLVGLGDLGEVVSMQGADRPGVHGEIPCGSGPNKGCKLEVTGKGGGDGEGVTPWGRGRGGTHVLDDLVGGWAVVLEDVVLGGAGGGHELLNDGLREEGTVSRGWAPGDGIGVLGSRRGGRRGCQGPFRRGTWGSQAVEREVVSRDSSSGAGGPRMCAHSVATAQGVDVEEGQGLVALEELEAGDFSWDWRRRGRVLAGCLSVCYLRPMGDTLDDLAEEAGGEAVAHRGGVGGGSRLSGDLPGWVSGWVLNRSEDEDERADLNCEAELNEALLKVVFC